MVKVNEEKVCTLLESGSFLILNLQTEGAITQLSSEFYAEVTLKGCDVNDKKNSGVLLESKFNLGDCVRSRQFWRRRRYLLDKSSRQRRVMKWTRYLPSTRL